MSVPLVNSSTFVTIVTGLPRSGTSLMMQMLENGGLPVLSDGIRAADTDNPKGYFEFEPVKQTRDDPSWLERAEGRAVKMVYLLIYDLPSTSYYRVIHVRREISEVVASQRAMLKRLGRAGAPLPDERLKVLFLEELALVKGWMAAQSNFDLLEVDYHDCIYASSAVATSVNRFLGGQLDAARMAQVPDPALYRQRLNRGEPSR